MARHLRLQVADGWYHVVARGIDRGDVFGDERDREHFVELLGEMVARYGVRVHAYVLMKNHYHLLLQTPHANLSRAMQWLNVSYGVWYNRRHTRVGPLFQGRFKAVPVEGDGAWAVDVSFYVHLNPVRVADFGLGKNERRAEALGVAPPSPDVVRARIAGLRDFPWSSYPAYAGYAPAPAWLTRDTILGRVRSGKEKATLSYRKRVETLLKGGVEEVETFAERMKGALAVGSGAFLSRLRGMVRGNANEQKAVRAWKRLLPFSRVIEVVAQEKGEPWERFRDRHGDWGRDVALWLGRRHCGLTLAELGAAAGGMTYPAVGQAVRVIAKRRESSESMRRLTQELEDRLLSDRR